MRKIVISVSFRREISSNCKIKLPKIGPEIVEKLEVFVLFDAISVQFPENFLLTR